MAVAAGIVETYDAIGNREDLSDMIYNISPTDTPFLSAIKKSKAKATNHEWQTDALAAASATNAHAEGLDAAPTDPAATTRLGNQTQILKKFAVVSGTQEAVDKAGRKSEMAFQVAKRMKEIKLDLEASMIGGAAVGNAKVAGSSGTAREMGSVYTYLTSNAGLGTNGVVSAGTGADLLTAGTDRDLTAAILDAVMTTTYTNGGNPNTLYVSPTNKTVVGDFTAGGATRYVTTDESKLNTGIDVYVGDFHTLKICPSRQIVGDNVLAIDHDYMAFAELRGITSKNLAVTGDSMRKEIVWEGTLEVCNEAAHGLIGDTNG